MENFLSSPNINDDDRRMILEEEKEDDKGEEYLIEIHNQLLKAFHYNVGEISEEAANMLEQPCSLTKSFIYGANEIVFRFAKRMARDLEYFAQHGNRKTINTKDVFLFWRNNPDLLRHLKQYLEEIKESKGKESKVSRKRRKK